MFICNIAISIWMNFGLVKCLAIPDILPKILDEFNIYQPTIILDDMLEMKKMTKVVKNLNYQGYSIGFSQKRLNQYQSGIILTDGVTQFKWINPTRAPILVVSKVETTEDLKEVEVSIGSEVIFLDRVSLKVYESYTINKIHITRYLGQFQAKNSSKEETTFIPSKDYISNMENRRENFYGIELTGAIYHMAEDPGNYSNLVKFFPNNDTYDITRLVNNPEYYFHNTFLMKLLKIMESKFNFTSKLFYRRDEKIGSPHILSNGSTVIGEGVFQNLVEGSIEFVWAPFGILPIRLPFVDFLPTIMSSHDAIYVPIEDSSKEIDWKVFFEPFAIDIWIAIVIKCIIFTTMVSIIEWFHDCKLVRL